MGTEGEGTQPRDGTVDDAEMMHSSNDEDYDTDLEMKGNHVGHAIVKC